MAKGSPSPRPGDGGRLEAPEGPHRCRCRCRCQRTAIALAGEPMPPGMRSGTATKRNVQRSSAAAAARSAHHVARIDPDTLRGQHDAVVVENHALVDVVAAERDLLQRRPSDLAVAGLVQRQVEREGRPRPDAPGAPQHRGRCDQVERAEFVVRPEPTPVRQLGPTRASMGVGDDLACCPALGPHPADTDTMRRIAQDRPEPERASRQSSSPTCLPRPTRQTRHPATSRFPLRHAPGVPR